MDSVRTVYAGYAIDTVKRIGIKKLCAQLSGGVHAPSQTRTLGGLWESPEANPTAVFRRRLFVGT